MRETGQPELHLAFAEEGHARKLATSVQAKATGNYPGMGDQAGRPGGRSDD